SPLRRFLPIYLTMSSIFCFTDTATTAIYPLSLHDALPICATPKPRHGWLRWMGSFRARITLALFAFFLMPTAVFGWATYSALAGEVARATRDVAQRAAAVAVLEFPDVDGNLHELAEHAGSDVLYYFRGELADVSSPEALALGVYGAWMPPAVYLSLEGGDELAAVETRT